MGKVNYYSIDNGILEKYYDINQVIESFYDYDEVINKWGELSKEIEKYEPEFSKDIQSYLKDINLESRQENLEKNIIHDFENQNIPSENIDNIIEVDSEYNSEKESSINDEIEIN